MDHRKRQFIAEILSSRMERDEEVFDRALERGYREVHGNCYGIPENEALDLRKKCLNALPGDFRKWARHYRIERIAGAGYDAGLGLAVGCSSVAA
jgi:hypothetical protein